MAHYQDYIPRKDAELLVFAKNFYTFALASYVRWGVPSPQALLDAQIGAFEAALAAFQQPNHGKIDTLAKDEAHAALVHALRTYIQGFVARNPGVTGDDKEKMMLPLRDTVPSAHPVPDVVPQTEAVPSGRRRHTVTAINPVTGNHKRPEMAKGVAFACRKRGQDEALISAKDMPSEFQVKSVRIFQWDEADIGQVCDYACAYENEGGKRGPWSDVVSVIVT
ncbi:MAG: hypothetical protein LBC77_06430 [Spirochaetaceae bacterium]|jgi:hypothetical protein|nr:hypothetical protein [Spirochaetaceae bacterium]